MLFVSICLLEIALRSSLERLVARDLENSLLVSPSLSLETFIIFSLFVVKVSGASKQKSSCRTSSSFTALTGNDFFVFDDYICCSFRFLIFFTYSRNISFLFTNRYINQIKVNEPRYNRCGVTPHFPKTQK